VPRATVDVDVNVFVGDDALAEVFQTLSSLGVRIDPTEARVQNTRDGSSDSWRSGRSWTSPGCEAGSSR
jgi:hypothetical protein